MFYLYLSFLFTFVTTSSICYVNDLYIKNDEDFVYMKKKNQYRDIIPTVAKNCFIYIPIITTFSEYNININYNNNEFNLYQCICHIFVAYLLIDFFFYICHLIMHIPLLYKWSHKLHHKYKYTVGMEALYLHWFDLSFGNILPLNLPIILMPNLHIITWMLYIVIIITVTVLSHGLILKNDHDIHHIYFNFNYGTGLYMDKIFNTVKKNIPISIKES